MMIGVVAWIDPAVKVQCYLDLPITEKGFLEFGKILGIGIIG